MPSTMPSKLAMGDAELEGLHELDEMRVVGVLDHEAGPAVLSSASRMRHQQPIWSTFCEAGLPTTASVTARSRTATRHPLPLCP
jgi:hypothetical protein